MRAVAGLHGWCRLEYPRVRKAARVDSVGAGVGVLGCRGLRCFRLASYYSDQPT